VVNLERAETGTSTRLRTARRAAALLPLVRITLVYSQTEGLEGLAVLRLVARVAQRLREHNLYGEVGNLDEPGARPHSLVAAAAVLDHALHPHWLQVAVLAVVAAGYILQLRTS
jgi:hypothetical protein